MKILLFVLFISTSIQLVAQSSVKAFNPMTAPGARRISQHNHILNWQNPSSVLYNDIYLSTDSMLVINLNPSAKVLSGYPSTVYSSMPINLLDTVLFGTKYYWRIVEYFESSYSIGDVWWFRIKGSFAYLWEYFTNGLGNWQIQGPQGINNWHISYYPGFNHPCLTLYWNPIFFGDSYVKYKTVFSIFWYSSLQFQHFYSHYEDGPKIGVAVTVDDGNTWTSIWELQPTTDIGPQYQTITFPNDDLQFAFYFSGDSFFTNNWYISNIFISSAIVLLEPPDFLKVDSDNTKKQNILEWGAGASTYPDTIMYYKIERKNGLPLSPGNFEVIAQVAPNVFRYIDSLIDLNNVYTYRIRTGIYQHESNAGNDATVYVPAVVPVEIISFTASVVNKDVTLSWQTVTETNNSGFQIERLKDSKIEGLEQWETIGFVKGKGSTTQPQLYSFKDENLHTGTYQYRLKQIDLDGTFEYSNTIEAEINAPLSFSLEQNFPNPFNSSTIIRFSIPSAGGQSRDRSLITTLIVYDVLGNEVTSLFNEEKLSGKYEINFDASQLASGIYYYQMRAGEFVETRKMILLK